MALPDWGIVAAAYYRQVEDAGVFCVLVRAKSDGLLKKRILELFSLAHHGQAPGWANENQALTGLIFERAFMLLLACSDFGAQDRVSACPSGGDGAASNRLAGVVLRLRAMYALRWGKRCRSDPGSIFAHSLSATACTKKPRICGAFALRLDEARLREGENTDR